MLRRVVAALAFATSAVLMAPGALCAQEAVDSETSETGADLPPVPAPPVHEARIPADDEPFIEMRPPSRRIYACWDPRDGGADRGPDALPEERCEPRTLELIELYTFGGFYGVAAGAGLADAFEVTEGGAVFGLVSLLGAASILSVWGLSRTDSWLPGMPAAISTGILAGFIEGLALYGAFIGSPFEEGSGLSMLGIGTGVAALGVAVSYLFRPTVADSSVVRSGLLWGAFFGGMANLVREAPEAGERRLTAVTVNVGLVAGIALAQLLDLRRSQVLAVDAGGFAGLVVGGVAALAADADRSTRGWLLGAPALAGMIVGAIFAAGGGDAVELEPLRVQPTARLVPGGFVLGAAREL